MYHALIFSVHVLGLRRPSGPHRIGSFLREHSWDVEVIDYTTTFTLDELQELARSRVTSKTKFIGFSCFFSHWEQKLENFVNWFKKTYPDVAIIMGGQTRPRIENPNIDYYIHGYAENAMLELVKHIIGTPGVKIAFDPMFFGSKKVITANDVYPSYPMKSLRVKYEDRDDIQPWEWLTVEFSRGCKFKCAYCNFPILGVKGDYSRDASDFEIEMKDNYDRWGVSHYYVADETFNDRTEKIEKFAQVVDRLDFKPTFAGFIRADLLVSRRQDWEILDRLGFYGHFYGIETMNAKTAKAIGKGMDPIKLRTGLLEAREYFRARGPYRGSMGIVVGLPHETIESQLETLQWCDDNWQGESLHVWPLEIPIDPKQDVLSTLSSAYNDYGYRPSNKEPPPPPWELKEVNDPSRVKHGSSNLIWENDNMSFADACQISNDVYRKMIDGKVKYGVTMFNLGDHTYCTPLDKVLKEKSQIELPEQTTHAREKEYRDKKLNK